MSRGMWIFVSIAFVLIIDVAVCGMLGWFTLPALYLAFGWIFYLQRTLPEVTINKAGVVTAVVKEMSFAKPMKIGDTLCVYTHVNRVGRTSMTLKVEAWAQRYLSDLMERVTDADFMRLLDRVVGGRDVEPFVEPTSAGDQFTLF